MNEFELINQLLDFYESLLTDKQLEIMSYYYRDNYSLNEIAEIKNVSKAAIHDLIQRSVKLLHYYESKLALLDKFNKRNLIYAQLENENNQELIENLKNID